MLQFRTLTLVALFGLASLLVSDAAVARADDDFVIDVGEPQRSRYPLALPMPVGGDGASASEVLKVASFDLDIAGWFKVMDKKGFLANLSREGLSLIHI